MLIYQLVFGTDRGQVNCAFHDDSRASAGVGPNGEYNCFACGAKAHDAVGFIAKYFGISIDRATRIHDSLNNVQQYRYTKLPLVDYQIEYLKRIGLSDEIISKNFFRSSVGKLMYQHTWSGIPVGYTWFNHPTLPDYNASADKYKYDKNVIGGMLTPYDDVCKYNTLVLCEGEKDMLTAKSKGIPNAVAKVGGAISYVIGGVNLLNKKVIICYDCDAKGREGADHDAALLTERFGCKVKVIDLGLQDKEDLNDYFMKYNHTVDDFNNLIKATPIYVPVPQTSKSKVTKFVESLTKEDLIELEQILKNKKEN